MLPGSLALGSSWGAGLLSGSPVRPPDVACAVCLELVLFRYGETLTRAIWVLSKCDIDRFCAANVGVTADAMKRPTNSKQATIVNFLKLFIVLVHLLIDS